MLVDSEQFDNSNEVIKYADIDLNFTPNPFTRDAVVLTNVNAIRRSVLNIIRYSRFELPDSERLISAYDYLFERGHDLTINAMRNDLIFTIEKFEKRVKILNIQIEYSDSGNISLSIFYEIAPLKIEDVINYTIRRVN